MKIITTLKEFTEIVRRCEWNHNKEKDKNTRRKHEIILYDNPCSGCVLYKFCLGRNQPSFINLFEIIPEPEDEEDYDGEDDD